MINIPIFLSADNNYAPFVATTIASICDNTKSFCEFYILDGGITKENQKKICDLKMSFPNFSIEFIKIDLDKEFASIDYKNSSEYVSLSTYNRFLIPQLKPDLGKVLYSDVDVIVLGDIAEMYNEDLNDFALGAVVEEFGQNFNNRKYFNFAENHKYFSAGNLIIDCDKWRKDNITEKLYEIEKVYRHKLKFADMDILNIYFNDNYKMLPAKYCYINQNYFFSDVPTDIIIRHYNGSIKPWHINFENDTIHDVLMFWHYAKLTSFYDQLWSNCNNLNTSEIKRQLRVYKMMNVAQAKIRNKDNNG